MADPARKRLAAVTASNVERGETELLHRIAYFVASGRRWSEIARELGILVTYIRALTGSDQFRPLVDQYRLKIDRGDPELVEFEKKHQEDSLRTANMQLALEEQQFRLINQPESYTHRDLADLIAQHAERLDAAKVVSGTVDLATNLALARQRRSTLAAERPPSSAAESREPSSTPAEAAPADTSDTLQ